jgi:hypothetical protein
MRNKNIVAALLTIIFSFTLHAQVVVNPVGIFFDPLTRTAEAEIKNVSTKPIQVELSFEYMYENWSDSLGKVLIIKNDTLGKEKYSLDKYIKVFPKKLIIPPGKEQTVRMLLMNVGNLEDGTYWTRLKTRAVEMDKQFDTTGKNATIGSKFKIFTDVTQPVVYQKGKVFTGVDIKKFERVADIKEGIVIELEMERAGNSPFWGSIMLFVKDNSTDKIVAMNRDVCPIFFSQKRRLAFPKKLFKKFTFPGTYTVQIVLNNENMTTIPEDRRYNKLNIEKEIEIRIE